MGREIGRNLAVATPASNAVVGPALVAAQGMPVSRDRAGDDDNNNFTTTSQQYRRALGQQYLGTRNEEHIYVQAHVSKGLGCASCWTKLKLRLLRMRFFLFLPRILKSRPYMTRLEYHISYPVPLVKAIARGSSPSDNGRFVCSF